MGHMILIGSRMALNIRSIPEHYEFWSDQMVPSSWVKFKDIALYWIANGVDGFRFDMAEMVPVEFWSYMNSHIKMNNPDAFLLAEVYNPGLYRDYILQRVKWIISTIKWRCTIL